MSFRVHIEPSHHEFEVHDCETLLEAGLRAGLNLPFSCGNGSCGECRARLIDGLIEPIRHADFRFPPLERQQGWFLMCANTAASDLRIEAHEVSEAVEIPSQRVTAKVHKLERLQDEVAILHLRLPRTQPFRFLAGQCASLRFDGQPEVTLPIASCPCHGLDLAFHVRRREGDTFSHFVFDKARRGQKVRIEGPTGDFTLHEDNGCARLFIAWETGFAPIQSLIEHVIAEGNDEPLCLYWLSAIPNGHYLSNYCRSWRDAFDEFHYESVDLKPVGNEDWREAIQRIIAERPRLACLDVYVTAPTGEAAWTRESFLAAGVAEERFSLFSMEE